MDKIIDFIAPFKEFLIILKNNGVSVKDVKYIAPCLDYQKMCDDKTTTYHGRIDTLSKRYGIPKGTLRRKIGKLLKRLKN